MKQIALIVLALGVALAGYISIAEARGQGWGRGAGYASCPAWKNASYGNGPGAGPAMARSYGRGNAQGFGPGPGWMRGAAANPVGQSTPAGVVQTQQ